MGTPKKQLGRPPTGRRYTERLMVYASPEQTQQLQELADRWGVSQAEAIRRLIEDAARREGLE